MKPQNQTYSVLCAVLIDRLGFSIEIRIIFGTVRFQQYVVSVSTPEDEI